MKKSEVMVDIRVRAGREGRDARMFGQGVMDTGALVQEVFSCKAKSIRAKDGLEALRAELDEPHIIGPNEDIQAREKRRQARIAIAVLEAYKAVNDGRFGEAYELMVEAIGLKVEDPTNSAAAAIAVARFSAAVTWRK